MSSVAQSIHLNKSTCIYCCPVWMVKIHICSCTTWIHCTGRERHTAFIIRPLWPLFWSGFMNPGWCTGGSQGWRERGLFVEKMKKSVIILCEPFLSHGLGLRPNRDSEEKRHRLGCESLHFIHIRLTKGFFLCETNAKAWFPTRCCNFPIYCAVVVICNNVTVY